jgi:FkbM family methyltransferase
MDLASFPITAGTLSAAEIRQLVGKEDPVILEVGANCGQTTLEFLQAMPRATIHAFEPDPRAIAKFRSKIAHPNVYLYECAIGAVDGTINFHQSSGVEHVAGFSEGWDESGSIRRPNNHLTMFPWVKFERQITVPILTLDTWSERHQVRRADFIWADVQGAEGDLVDGAARFLRSLEYLYTEYSNEECYEGQIKLADLLAKLPDFTLVKRFPGDALFQKNVTSRKPLGIVYPQIQF